MDMIEERIGLKKAELRKENEPRWKRRTEGDIKRLRQEVNFLEREIKGELGLKKKRKLRESNERYSVKRKGLKTVIEARDACKNFDISKEFNNLDKIESLIFIRRCTQNSMEMGVRPSDVPNAEEKKDFGVIFGASEKGHNRAAEWLKDIENELGNDKHLQERVVISVGKVTKQGRKVSNWKATGKDGIQGYWIKNLRNLHEQIAV